MSETVTAHDEHVAPAQAWDAIAAGYDLHVTPRETELATTALGLAGLQPGDRFLDVAAGTGGLSLPAAHMGASVVATDWSPRMIERFEARVRAQGVTNASGHVMDCHALDFDDNSFDVTGSQFGVMLVANQPQALREMVRVTKVGGRVILITFADPGKFEALQLFVGALKEIAPDFEGIPDDPPPLEFQVSDPSVLENRLREAGLKDVIVDTSHQEQIEVRSGQELWDWCLGSNPLPGMLTSDLNRSQRTDFVAKLDARIHERAGGDGTAVLTAALNIGVGTK